MNDSLNNLQSDWPIRGWSYQIIWWRLTEEIRQLEEIEGWTWWSKLKIRSLQKRFCFIVSFKIDYFSVFYSESWKVALNSSRRILIILPAVCNCIKLLWCGFQFRRIRILQLSTLIVVNVQLSRVVTSSSLKIIKDMKLVLGLSSVQTWEFRMTSSAAWFLTLSVIRCSWIYVEIYKDVGALYCCIFVWSGAQYSAKVGDWRG